MLPNLEDWVDVDLTMGPAQYAGAVQDALRLKGVSAQDKRELLSGRVVYLMFFNQSMRTRSSFQAGLAKMGGHAVELSPGTAIYTPVLAGDDVPYSTERVADVARILSEYGDAIAVRLYGEPTGWVYGNGHRVLREFAEHATVPVINMECDRFHPCQALADMMTITELFGSAQSKRIAISWAYSGSWHKPVAVPQSLLLAAAKSGMDITLAHPPGFELDSNVMEAAHTFAAASSSTINVVNDFEEGVRRADIVYAKSWCSLKYLPDDRQGAVDDNMMTAAFEAHRSWMMDETTMKLAAPKAVYMHCLPADRDQEVSSALLEGPSSVVYRQAANRLHAQNAIMLWLMGQRQPR